MSELIHLDTSVQQQVSDVKEDQQTMRKDFIAMYMTLYEDVKMLKEEKKRIEGNATPPSNQMPTQDVREQDKAFSQAPENMNPLPTQDVRKQDKAFCQAHDNINKAYDEVKHGIGGHTQGIYAPAPAPSQSPPHHGNKPSHSGQGKPSNMTGNPMGNPTFSKQTHQHNNHGNERQSKNAQQQSFDNTRN